MPASTGGLVGYDQLNNLPSPAVSFGSGVSQGLLQGSLFRQVFSAANAVSPGALGADNVIASFALPANSFDGLTIGGQPSNRGIVIAAAGTYAANANTKTIKIIFNPASAVVGQTVGGGGTTLVTSGAIVSNNLPWLLYAMVFKIGGPGSNTQYAQSLLSLSGAVLVAPVLPVFPTANESAPILVAITGNAATNVNDINLNYFEVTGMN